MPGRSRKQEPSDYAEGGPRGDQVIAHDVMNVTYAHDPGTAGTRLHCVSNLDVKGLELMVDGKAKPTVATLDPAQYQRINWVRRRGWLFEGLRSFEWNA